MTLYQMAKNDGGLTKTGKISAVWARGKLAKPRTKDATKRELRRFLNDPTNKDFCPERLGSLGGFAKAGYIPPRPGPETRACGKKLAAMRRGPKRKKNPDSRNKDLQKAIKLFRKFREQEPEFVDELTFKIPNAGMVIGYCDGILYNTVRGGKKEFYKHEFTGKSCPLLCSSADGKQLFFVGGAYDFTEDGIVDR